MKLLSRATGTQGLNHTVDQKRENGEMRRNVLNVAKPNMVKMKAALLKSPPVMFVTKLDIGPGCVEIKSK